MRFPKGSDFVCVYGWDEALYREALSWAKGDRRAVFVSEEERVSTDPRVKIYHLESPLQIEPLARKIAWSAVFRNMEVVGGDKRFQEELKRCHLAADLILSEASDWHVAVLKNGRANRSAYRRGMELKGAFTGVPALVVGAGPSLEKNGHLLKAFENRALIFAGGSALNAIDSEPHFAASIDPAAPHKQFKTHRFRKTPFCYQSRMSADNFSLMQGPKLLFPDASSAAINWLHGEETFDSGWTVGNFLTAAALHMGCSPIVFVGMDLCYSKGKKYAKIDASLPDGLIRVGDVWTQRDWLMSARWTEEKKGPFLDATEGGLLALPKKKLGEVLAEWPERGDLRKKVEDAIESLPQVGPSERWDEWDASLRRCIKNLYTIDDEVVYHRLLLPLWQIWKPIFEREAEVDPQQSMELHKLSFFHQVLEEHLRG